MRELYGTWAKTRNNVFRKIFVYRRSESVNDVICCLDRVNFRYLLLLRSVKFYKRLYLKSGLLHDIFWSFMIFNCDDWMRTVFVPLHKAISNLLSQLHDYVSGNAWYCMMCLSVYICISLSASAWLANKCVHIFVCRTRTFTTNDKLTMICWSFSKCWFSDLKINSDRNENIRYFTFSQHLL